MQHVKLKESSTICEYNGPMESRKMKMGKRLRGKRETFGWTLKELSERMPGYSPSRISNWEQGIREFGPDDAEMLAQAFGDGTAAAWFLYLLDLESEKDSRVPSLSVKGIQRKEIPVVGTTQGGPDRHWEELGYPVGWGDEYAVIESDDPHAYLLRVEGDSMSPRINIGEYVLVEPSLDAQPGDLVVVRLTSGEVMLKYFRADYGEEIALESHNHGFTMKTVKKTDIVFIHQVSGTLFRRKIKKRV